jgi:hypothetical protein
MYEDSVFVSSDAKAVLYIFRPKEERAVHRQSIIARTRIAVALAAFSLILPAGSALSQISVTVSKKYAQRTRIAVPSFQQKAVTPDEKIT